MAVGGRQPPFRQSKFLPLHLRIDKAFQHRQVVRHGDEHDAPIHREIRMHGNIAKTDDLLPRDFRKAIARGVGQLCGGFADDGKLLQNRALDEFIGQEARFVETRHKAFDGLDGVEDVLQVQRVTPHG